MTDEVKNEDTSSLPEVVEPELEEVSEAEVFDETTQIRDFMEATPGQVTQHIFEVLQKYPEVAKRVYLKLSCTFGGPAH